MNVVLKLLVAVLLLEAIVWGAARGAREILVTEENLVLRRAAQANLAEFQTCETRRTMLLKAIKREGLWARLGLPGQPWLR